MNGSSIRYNGIMQLHKFSHGVYQTEYHIAYITKYRRPILNPGLQAYLRKIIPKVLRTMSGVELVELGLETDHLHMVLVIPPRYAVSDVIGTLKGQTAKLMRAKFSWLEKVYWKENIVWSPGFFVSSIGVDEKQIIKYVAWQGRQDLGQIKMEL